MKNILKMEGVVLEALPNTQFMVEIESGQHIRCYLSGKMNIHHIHVLVGDKVSLELAPNIEIKNQIGRIVLRK